MIYIYALIGLIVGSCVLAQLSKEADDDDPVGVFATGFSAIVLGCLWPLFVVFVLCYCLGRLGLYVIEGNSNEP